MKQKMHASCDLFGKTIKIFGLLTMIFGVVVACGGGGGGGGGSAASITYTGSTSRAALSDANSETLVEESFEGALTSDTLVPIRSAVAGAGDEDQDPPMAMALQSIFEESISSAIDDHAGNAGGSLARSETASSSVTGDCGGSASYSVSYNESSGSFSGNFNYNGYCSGGILLSGNMTFSGLIDTGSGFFDYFVITITNMTTTVGGQSNTVSGTLDCDFAGSDLTITTDLVVSQSSSGRVCWLNNYTVQVTGGQMEISGRYYHPTHGYIDFNTTTPLVFSGTDSYPSSGVIVFTGADGPGGNPTSAQLTAHSATHCQVIADTDGDGVRDDFDTGIILWTSL